MKYLITGAGFLARYIARLLCENNHDVLILTRSERNIQELNDFVKSPRCKCIVGDINYVDFRLLEKPDCIIHTAAMKYIDLCEQNQEEAIKINIQGTQRMIEFNKVAKAKFIHISTDKVCQPTTFYGATKMIAERLAASSGATIVRLSNLFGSTGSIIPRWIESINRNGEIFVTDCRMNRYFCHPHDAAELIYKTSLEPPPGERNRRYIKIPNCYNINIMRLAQKLRKKINKECNIIETGIRPYEKLCEELFLPEEKDVVTSMHIEEISESLLECWFDEFIK